MNRKIVLASGNAGKLKELQDMLGSTGAQFITQKSLGIEDAEETRLSFVENAILKARHASAASGLPAIADDSGLEVDALNGQPGIYSARFAGEPGNDEANNRKLLQELEATPAADRTARFHCVIVYMRHAEDPTPLICHGSWEGRILEEAAGDNGFGYDPLFYVPEHNCSSAQLSPSVKNRISHRARAMRALLQQWPDAGSGT